MVVSGPVAGFSVEGNTLTTGMSPVCDRIPLGPLVSLSLCRARATPSDGAVLTTGLYSAFVGIRSEAPGGDDAGSRTPVTGIAAADDCAIRAAVHGQSAYSTDAQLYEARTRLLHHWRRRAVELLRLRGGEVVIDVGCGTGLCFELLQQRIGPGGTIVGIDASARMLELAGRRVADHGWRNVVLVQAPVEDAIIPEAADAVLFCAVHDVLQSPAALDNLFAGTRPGARVAAVGGKWAPPWPLDSTR